MAGDTRAVGPVAGAQDGQVAETRGTVVITGGAGFVGCNLADALLADGRPVVLFDSFARPGAEAHRAWLEARHGPRLRVVRGDVRDREALRGALRGATMVYHLAAEGAATTSLGDPVRDFEVNAGGTLAVLEEARALDPAPGLLFTSTNEVYGALPDVELALRGGRHEPVDAGLRGRGVGAGRALDFHGPHGCSKGAADQYVLDYARSFGLRTVVFRVSSVYGPRQSGTEDQDWVAHLVRRALEGRPVALHGDGRQVRDVLFVTDLVEAMRRAEQRLDALAGRVFNVGGGPANTLSPLELLDEIEARTGRRPDARLAPGRAGEQRWYVSDIRALCAATGWAPRVSVGQGLGRLHDWLAESLAEAALPGTTAVAGGAAVHGAGGRAPAAAARAARMEG